MLIRNIVVRCAYFCRLLLRGRACLDQPLAPVTAVADETLPVQPPVDHDSVDLNSVDGMPVFRQLVDALMRGHDEGWLRGEITEQAGLADILSPYPDNALSQRTFRLVTEPGLTLREADDLVDALHEVSDRTDAASVEALLRVTIAAARLGAPFSMTRVGRLLMDELRTRPARQ